MKVFGVTTSGGYAEYATASATAIAIKPEALSHEQAAALPVSGLMQWQALDRGRLDLGQAVLVAGRRAMDISPYSSPSTPSRRVIGTGSAHNREFVLGLGADEFIDYTHGEVADAVSGVDVALDTVGGATTTSPLPRPARGRHAGHDRVPA